jgi:hypothetical protein
MTPLPLAMKSRSLNLSKTGSRNNIDTSGVPYRKESDDGITPEVRRSLAMQTATTARQPHNSYLANTPETPTKPKRGVASKSFKQMSAIKPVGGAVKAIAAIFERSGKNSPPISSPSTIPDQKAPKRGSILSQYASNTSPSRSLKPVVPVLSDYSPVKQYKAKFESSENETQKQVLSVRCTRFSTSENSEPLVESHVTEAVSSNQNGEPFMGINLRSTAVLHEPMFRESGMTPQDSMDIPKPPRLGLMVPPQEQPPVARYISYARPQSAASFASTVRYDGPTNSGKDTSASDQNLSRSNSILYAQIQSLKRQLEIKSEEVLRLQRQLEAQENMDVGILSEQLREANRECKIWRERAEAAERRVAVFERFATKLRKIQSSQTGSPIIESLTQQYQNEDITPGSAEIQEQVDGSDSFQTETKDAVIERIRKSLLDMTIDGLDGTADTTFLAGSENLSMSKDRVNDMMKVWPLVRELLRKAECNDEL